jgi:DUF177 domain-containing protein
VRRLDLHSLRFHDASEVWRTLPVEVQPFVYGGLEYHVPGDVVQAELTAARVGDNLTLTLLVDTHVLGPCQRCLADADIVVGAEGIEYVRHGESSAEVVPDEDDVDAYVVAHQLDLERWVRDLVADALPQKLLCRDDCRGLCPLCGADLNADPDHRHEEA